MQLRHRTPTIFSIYMVDVLCCALGCVVLMWQYNLNEAEEKAAAERTALESLAATNLSLGLTTDAKNKLEADNDRLKKELKDRYLDIQNLVLVHKAELEKARAAEALALKNGEDLAKQLHEKILEYKTVSKELDDKNAKYLLIAVERDNALAEIKNLTLVHKTELENARAAEALVRKAKDELEKLLEKERIDYKNLTKSSGDLDKSNLAKLAENARIITELNERIEQARQQLAKLEKDAKSQGVKLGETNLTLQDSLARNRNLDAQVEQLQADLKQGRIRYELLDQETIRLRKELADFNTRYKDLASLNKQELDLTRALVEKLKAENVSLSDKVQIVLKNMKNIESRFAGISLTGKQVIFLVDMSGSMGWKDDQTEDPDKWPIVCETVGKLMMSLPDLKQYQIIMFSSGVSFPLGKEGRWLEFEGQKTVDAAVKKLKTLKPNGGTNIHAAMTEVFKYRQLGLDTVYFFSDGLPTSGEGLPPVGEQGGKPLNERQRTEILSAHVRKTLKTVWNRPILNSPPVRVNTIGFFYESPDVGSFLWALAREHDGSFVGMSKP